MIRQLLLEDLLILGLTATMHKRKAMMASPHLLGICQLHLDLDLEEVQILKDWSTNGWNECLTLLDGIRLLELFLFLIIDVIWFPFHSTYLYLTIWYTYTYIYTHTDMKVNIGNFRKSHVAAYFIIIHISQQMCRVSRQGNNGIWGIREISRS